MDMFTPLRSSPVTQDLTELFGELRYLGIADKTPLRLTNNFSHISDVCGYYGEIASHGLLDNVW
jgi:hypothetical protein